MRHIGSMAAVLLLLSACGGGSASRGNIAGYDFGSPTMVAPTAFGIERIEVRAPSWLGSTAMQYRLGADDPARRRVFAESRWVAPPAELIETALKQRLVGNVTRQGCRLALELDEFVQVFDAQGNSQAQLAVRASLMTRQGNQVLAQRAFNLADAAGRDARGGVAAYAAMQQQLAAEMAQWLQGSAGQCRD